MYIFKTKTILNSKNYSGQFRTLDALTQIHLQNVGILSIQKYVNTEQSLQISRRGSLPYLSADFEVLDPGEEYYENDNNATL